jgi:hypothetical protein
MISNDITAHPLSIAIACALGLCCDFGAIVCLVSWPPVVFDWNAKTPRKRGS